MPPKPPAAQTSEGTRRVRVGAVVFAVQLVIVAILAVMWLARSGDDDSLHDVTESVVPAAVEFG